MAHSTKTVIRFTGAAALALALSACGAKPPKQLPPEPGAEPVLSLTRAWTLVRFLNSSMLETARCRQCGGEFIVQPQRRQRHRPPCRQGQPGIQHQRQERCQRLCRERADR